MTNIGFKEHRAWNGEHFSDLMKQGWGVYKAAWDAPFVTPWLHANHSERAD